MNKINTRYIPIFLLIIFISFLNVVTNSEKQATLITFSFLIFLLGFFKYFFVEEKKESLIYFKLNNLNNFLNIAFLLTLTILTQNKYLNIETITWDVHSYLVAAQEINYGFIPLETQWESKGPLLLYLYNFFSIASNKNYIVFRLVNDLILFISVLFLYLTVFKSTGDKVKAFLSSLLFILITSYVWFVSEFSEIYCLAILSIIYYLFNTYEHTNKLLLSIGFLFGVSTLINQGTVIFLIPYLIVLFNEYKNNNLIKNTFYFSSGFLFPHLIFITIYLLNGMFDVYFSQYYYMPLAYIEANESSLYELKVVMRRFFKYDLYLYISIFSILVFSFQAFYKQIILKKFMILNDLAYLNLLAAMAFYFIAGHNYYHHLFYVIFFFSTMIVNIDLASQKNLIIVLLFCSLISVGFKTFQDSTDNLMNLNEVYENYPLRQLSQDIDNNFKNDQYDILAMDYVLILYYLDKPNFSYIVHPSNHYEEFIVSELLRLERIETNEFNHVSKMIEDEPEVIICSGKMIIKGVPQNIDFYNCAIDDYKKNYKKIETKNLKENQNLDYYSDPFKEINVYIKQNN